MRQPSRSRIFLPLLLIALAALALAACTSSLFGGGNPLTVLPTGDTVVEMVPSATLESTATPVPPTHTLTAIPTATVSPTATLHPMMIQSMRQTPYPGSAIAIEEQLDSGGNYNRYYASYYSEGLKIYGLLTVPYGEAPAGGWPAIIFNHGYIPPDVYRTTERYVAYVDYLARSGYVVYRIDYRGHDRSEGEANGAYGNPGYTADVINAVAAIQQFAGVNPDKIGMWGHSMGGYLTLRAMVISPAIKAGVIWGGVVGSYPDLMTRWRRGPRDPAPTVPPRNRRWSIEWTQQYGSPEENPDFWALISSNSYLGEISGPLQLHHADTDESVPIEFSQILAAQLEAAGQPVEFYTYEGDDHNLSTYFSLAMSRTVEFFDRILKEQPVS